MRLAVHRHNSEVSQRGKSEYEISRAMESKAVAEGQFEVTEDKHLCSEVLGSSTSAMEVHVDPELHSEDSFSSEGLYSINF